MRADVQSCTSTVTVGRNDVEWSKARARGAFSRLLLGAVFASVCPNVILAITHSGSLPEATHLGLFADWKAVIVSSSARIVPCVTQYMHACRELLGTPLI